MPCDLMAANTCPTALCSFVRATECARSRQADLCDQSRSARRPHEQWRHFRRRCQLRPLRRAFEKMLSDFSAPICLAACQKKYRDVVFRLRQSLPRSRQTQRWLEDGLLQGALPLAQASLMRQCTGVYGQRRGYGVLPQRIANLCDIARAYALAALQGRPRQRVSSGLCDGGTTPSTACPDASDLNCPRSWAC